MQKCSFNPTRWGLIASLLALTACAAYAAEEKPFGANDPYRPYDQAPVPPTDVGPYHEGLFLNTDLGVSFVEQSSSLKTDPGVRFSVGPGYTLHNEPLYEVGAQFETGVIYNPVHVEQPAFGPFGPFTSRTHADLFQVPFLVDIIYAFHATPCLSPYIGVGGGGVYRALNSSSLGDSHSTDAAFQAMTGVRWSLTDVHELVFGYKFLNTFSGGSDLRTHTLSVGWIFRF